MHYQSDITTVDDKLWTRDELDRWLGKHFKGATILLPDDNFYTAIRKKDDLLLLAHKIKKQLKVKQKISFSFSDQISTPGKCSINDKKIQIDLPVHIFGDPLRAAAYCSHLIAHALLLIEKKQPIDQQEHERLVDIACIQAGLGVVVLNGSSVGGWKNMFKKRYLNHSDALGYYTIPRFAQKVKEKIEQENKDELQVSSHVVKWLRPMITNKSLRKNAQQPNAIKQALSRHRHSMKWFVANIVCAFLLIGVVSYFTLNSLLATDTKLTQFREQADELLVSYNNCVKRYESLENSLPKDQISSERLLSYEQVRCKSLENRYNAATQSYNNYLREKN